MLIKTLLRKTLNVKRHRIIKVIQTADSIEVYLDYHRRRGFFCGRGGTSAKKRGRLNPRRWKQVPLWGFPVTLIYSPARVSCPKCGKVCVEAIPWSQGKCRLTRELIFLLSSMAKLLAWDVVAKMFKVSWNTVRSAVKQSVDYGLKHRTLGKVLYIGIDELSRRKGHKYVTNVYDLDQKRLIWSGEGRKKETLEEFFKVHGKALKGSLMAVCCDMWQPYIDTVKANVEDNVVLVFDKFHLISHLNKAVDEVRKEEAGEL